MTDQLLPSNITLLIVDDSESDRLTYSRYLQSDSERNYRIIEAATLEEGLELWRSQQPDIVLIELNLPDGNGLTFLEAINIDHADRVPVIMLTGQGNEKMAVNAMKLGASDYLLKGEVTPKLLTSSIRQVMRETALIQQLQRSQLSHQAELEERNKLLERISEKLQCTVEELKVSAEEKIEQHRLLQYEDDRKIAVESLHASEAKSRVILETIPDLMFRVGSDQVYREMVTSYRDIALFPRDYDLVGRSVADVLPPEAVQRKLHYLQQALQTGELQIYEQRFQIGDHLQYEEVTIIKSGEDEGLFMIRDISDRKRAEQALQQLNQSLEAKIRERTQELWQVNQIQRAIVCSTDYAIISTDLNGIIHTFNTGAEKMLGYSMEEIIGNATPALFFDAQELSDKITTASKILGKDIGVGIEALCNMAREGLIDEEWINIRKDGSRFPISISMSILKDDNDQVIGFLSVRKDISDRKQAEKALEESQRLLQAVLDCFPLAVFWKDRQSVLLGCNQIFATLSGLTSSREVVGKSNFDFSYSEEEAHKYTLDDREVMESGLSKIGIQETITLANGEIRWVETNKIPLRNLLGEVVGVVCTFQDISDRKFAEEALAESEAFNRQLIKEFPIGLASCRMDGQLVFVNSVFAKMLGRTIEETLELTYWDITPIKYAEQEAAQLERIQIEGRYGSYEKEYIHKDGHLVPVLLNGLAIAQKGELIIWSSVQDISDRKQAELQLQKTTERLALALKSGAIGCWEWDIQQNIAFWDDRMYELYGVCKEKDLRIVYEIWAGAIHPEDRAESEMTTQQIATGQVEEYDTEFRVVHPDGSIHFVKAYGTLNRDASGNPLSIIGINFDISDRKFAEESLAESEAFNRQLVEEFPIG
ncbi:MAG: PAS domain S-box protein, partial [Pseudanabaena sp. ELA645]